MFERKINEKGRLEIGGADTVELAKKFGQDTSPAFVNGVLAKFA